MIDHFFLCIGAQKSGTTWLARVLSRHPDLFLTPVKEIHYFDHVAGLTQHLNAWRRWSRFRKYHQRMWTQWGRFGEHWSERPWYADYMRRSIDDAWYERLFAHRGNRRFAGEVTPEYALLGPAGFQHVRRLAPAARILFIMRDPVTQTWSQMLHYARSERLDISSLPHARLCELAELPRVRALRDYGKTLADVGEVFPPQQVMTLFYEDIHEDRAKALETVCRFIGLDFDPSVFPELSQRFNSSQDAAMPDAMRSHLRAVCAPIVQAVQARVGRVPEAWLKG